MYSYYSDKNTGSSGYASSSEILKHISQEEIFEFVFGYYPEEYVYVQSPFRTDATPGCFFFYGMDDKLRLSDFANQGRYGRIKLSCMDCFDAVQVKYQLSNFYQAVEFIRVNILKKRIGKPKREIPAKPRIKKQNLNNIIINPQSFDISDGHFWSPYEISKENLKEDGVFRISHYKLMYLTQPPVLIAVNEICYAYTEFEGQRKKLYSPTKKKGKFITNCTQNDIGGVKSLPEKGDQLIITKSYKDCRILRNQGVNSIWVQNEGMIPDEDLIAGFLKRFSEVFIFFDNDRAGVEAGIKFKGVCDNLNLSNIKHIFLPYTYSKYKITDPGDLLEKETSSHLRYFLNQNNIKINID